MDDSPATVDALYEAWVRKLQRENSALRQALIVALFALVLAALSAKFMDRLAPPKEGPK